MLSFLLIGKNEGWKLTKSLNSVFNFIKINKITDYEVIYVDSQSTDDSIVRVKKFPNIKIYQITGVCNASIARNIGAKESKGDILFFIDGDMEIQPDFYNVAFNFQNNLIYPFISGGLINFNYDSDWNLISNSNYGRNVHEDKYEHTTGGIFIITRDLWVRVNGMRTKFKVNEDIDFGLRLSKIGYPILRKKEIIAHHHTIPYTDSKRTWISLFNKSEFYPMVLFRFHITNSYVWKKMIFENYTMFVLIIILSTQIFHGFYSFFILYMCIILLKTYNRIRKISINLLANIFKLILRDIIRFFAIFLFFPQSPKIEFIRITNDKTTT